MVLQCVPMTAFALSAENGAEQMVTNRIYDHEAEGCVYTDGEAEGSFTVAKALPPSLPTPRKPATSAALPCGPVCC